MMTHQPIPKQSMSMRPKTAGGSRISENRDLRLRQRPTAASAPRAVDELTDEYSDDFEDEGSQPEMQEEPRLELMTISQSTHDDNLLSQYEPIPNSPRHLKEKEWR